MPIVLLQVVAQLALPIRTHLDRTPNLPVILFNEGANHRRVAGGGLVGASAQHFYLRPRGRKLQLELLQSVDLLCRNGGDSRREIVFSMNKGIIAFGDTIGLECQVDVVLKLGGIPGVINVTTRDKKVKGSTPNHFHKGAVVRILRREKPVEGNSLLE